jgi:hypothetical protein
VPRTSALPRRRRASTALALLAVLIAMAADPAPAAGAAAAPGSRTTWTLEPSNPDGSDGRVSFRHVLDPGAELTEHVTLTNFSDHPATFSVYAGDGLLTADGQFDLPPAGTAPEAAGSWIALGDPAGELGEPGAAQRLEVDPGAAVTLPFVVRVPADATPGDHPAGIVAALTTAAPDGVTLDSRVGVRLHLRVTGDLAPALAVEVVSAAYTPSWNPFGRGTLRVEYAVANVGNVRLGATTTTEAAGPFGLARTATPGPDVPEALPGATVGGGTEVAAWPFGRLTGSVAVAPAVVGSDEVPAVPVAVGSAFGVWAVPWSQLALVLLLAGAVPGARWLLRRREDATQRRITAAVEAARGPGTTTWTGW